MGAVIKKYCSIAEAFYFCNVQFQVSLLVYLFFMSHWLSLWAFQPYEIILLWAYIQFSGATVMLCPMRLKSHQIGSKHFHTNNVCNCYIIHQKVILFLRLQLISYMPTVGHMYTVLNEIHFHMDSNSSSQEKCLNNLQLVTAYRIY